MLTPDTVIENCCEAVSGGVLESVTVIVKLPPVPLGVPDIVPVAESRFKPAGKCEPEPRAHV